MKPIIKKTLILTQRQIEKLIDMRKTLRIVEEAFGAQGQGEVQMPPKIYIHLDKYKGDFRAMPAFLDRMKACGIKWVNVHPANKRYGLPAVMAVIILNDPRTGFPLAIMGGTLITNLRTGAAGGVAAKYLANKDSSTAAFVGCGAQARTQLMALKELFRLREVRVSGCRESHAIAFIKETGSSGIDMRCCSNIEDCVRGADIVVTTTPVRKPIVKSEWIGRGVHINAIGADAKGKEELDPALLKRAKIVVDDKMQAIHSGEINVPISRKIIKETDIYATLGEVVTGKKGARISKDEITLFDSTGLAIQDVAVANYVYKEAIRRRLGRYANL